MPTHLPATLLAHHQLSGQLTVRDAKQHLPHPFDVPEGTDQLEIRFAFSPAAQPGLDAMLTLTLFDPNGFRGARHRDGCRHDLTLCADSATPGYLPGLLPAGQWVVQIDSHRILPGQPLAYTFEILCSAFASPLSPPLSLPAPSQPGRVVRPEPGWYRGDLHSHTDHSDAGDRTVAQLLTQARAAGLDFLFLTDHNTVSPLAEIDAAASPELLTAGGMELTTFWGHALVLGTRQWQDWRFRPGDGTIRRIAATADANRQLFVMAHPGSGGDPECTGCAWRYGEMMPGTTRAVEIWNGPWAGDSNNELALSYYYDWLNQGYRLVATAGSDTHSDGDYPAGPGFNVVYADNLSEAALLRAIGAGHLYLSSGPQLLLEAQTADGTVHPMGATVDRQATVRLHWQACPADATLRVVVNCQLLYRQPTGAAGSYEFLLAPTEANWLVAEVRSATGVLLAITNPIFWEA